MNTGIRLVFLLLGFSSSTFSQSNFKSFETFTGNLIISAPSDFVSSSQDEINNKFPISNKPNVVISKPNGSVIITLTLSNDKQTFQEIIKQKPALLSSIKEKQNGKEIANEEIKINNHDFLLVSFVSPASKGDKYSKMFITSMNGKVLVGIVACPASIKEEWKPKIDQIIKSITIN